jgi:hypothetical protein
MLQVAQRAWPAAAVHDTVAAVVNGRGFRRSLQLSLAQRLFRWISDGLNALMEYLRASAPARWLAIGLAVLLVLLIVGRLLLAARARDEDDMTGGDVRRGRAGEDPWLAAARFTGMGQFEEAAHALYRGVVESAARTDRLRLDPSRTSGDYARELRTRNSPRYAAFRSFARRFDVAVYGHGPCDAATLGELTQLAEPFRGNRSTQAA